MSSFSSESELLEIVVLPLWAACPPRNPLSVNVNPDKGQQSTAPTASSVIY